MPSFAPTRRRKPVAGSQMVRADAGAFSAPGRALAAAGGAVSQVGGMLDELAIRKQTVINRKSIADARRKFSEEGAGLKLEMSQEGDRTKLGKIQQRRSSALRKNLITEDVAPEVREQIEADWADFESKTKIAVKTEEVRRLGLEAQVSVMGEYDRHLEDGNLLLATGSVNAAVVDGVFEADEGHKLIKAAEIEIQRKEVYKTILADPFRAEELLEERTDGGKFKNFKKLSDQDRRVFASQSRTAANRDQTEFYGRIQAAAQIEGMDASERRAAWHEVKSRQDAGRLSDTQAVALHNTIFKQNNLVDWVSGGKFSSRIANVSPTADEFDDEIVAIRRDISESKMLNSEQTRLLRMLDDTIAGVSAGGVNKWVMSYARKRADKYVTGRFEHQLTKDGKDALDSVEVGEIRSGIQIALDGFNANPKNKDATIQEADNFILTHLSKETTAKLSAQDEGARYTTKAASPENTKWLNPIKDEKPKEKVSDSVFDNTPF